MASRTTDKLKGRCPQDPALDEYHAHRESGQHEEWCIAQTRPLMMVTRTVQFTLDRTFTAQEQDEAKAKAIERGTSQHHILAERVRAEAAKTLWAAGFQVDYDFPERGDHIGFAHAPPANGQNLCSHCT